MIKTIIIDDEPKIRKGLKIMLNRHHPELEIIAEAGNVEDGVEKIATMSPKLVFLDIELSDGYSFEILNQLEKINFQIIFITAYDQYAIKAFKYSAVDYLLKPIEPSELANAIARAQKNISTVPESISPKIDLLKENLTGLKKIILKTAKKYYIVKVASIIRCQADQSYTTFYIEDTDPIMVSKPLKEYEELLPQNLFLRVHQSHLVNKNKVVGYNKEGFIELENSQTIPVSSRKKELVLDLLFK